MNSLSIIKYLVEYLAGTPFEPAVNLLLFCLLVAAVLGAIKLVLGKGTLESIRRVGAKAKSVADKHIAYAPEWESFRVRTEPYFSFVFYLLCGLCGVFSGLAVGIALVFFAAKAPLEIVALGIVWVLTSFIYMRFSLASASWAYHRIKNGKSDG